MKVRKSRKHGLSTEFIGFFLLAILINCSASSDESLLEKERMAFSHAYVYATGIAGVMKRITLIRSKTSLCAVRFTSFRRGNDAKPPSIFHSGSESLYAEYDWYFSDLDDVTFSSKEAREGHDKVDFQPYVGFGNLRFQTGMPFVKCGNMTLRWFYPSGVHVVKLRQSLEDAGVVVAPTKWKKIGNVNAADVGIIWYGYDESRSIMWIPKNELPPNIKIRGD